MENFISPPKIFGKVDGVADKGYIQVRNFINFSKEKVMKLPVEIYSVTFESEGESQNEEIEKTRDLLLKELDINMENYCRRCYYIKEMKQAFNEGEQCTNVFIDDGALVVIAIAEPEIFSREYYTGVGVLIVGKNQEKVKKITDKLLPILDKDFDDHLNANRSVRKGNIEVQEENWQYFVSKKPNLFEIIRKQNDFL